MSRIGVWLIGARGNIAVTAMVGARALARDEMDTTGLVTARPPYSDLDLPAVDEFVFGGHDVRDDSLVTRARQLQQRNGVPNRDQLDAVAADLDDIEGHVEQGTARNCGAPVERLATPNALDGEWTAADLVERVRADYSSFVDELDLDQLVVVNVASTEPPLANPGQYETRSDVERAIETDDAGLPASSLYAYAALVDGHPYANFTPSTGASLGGLRELAEANDVPHMGNDGKTGESLVKAALGPMFAGRNLKVRSWEGHNILGNTDGEVLEDDRNKQGKLDSKGDILEGILPDIEHNRVRIDHTPSLGDWKTAWDYIHFEGFLETKMTMQFTWEGSDSALAAPLVLDLVRLLSHADEHGEGGLQTHLASFFKAPLAVDEHDLSRQFDRLEAYTERHLRDPQPESEPTTTD